MCRLIIIVLFAFHIITQLLHRMYITFMILTSIAGGIGTLTLDSLCSGAQSCDVTCVCLTFSFSVLKNSLILSHLYIDSTTLFSEDIHSAGPQGGAQTLKRVHSLTLLLWLVLHFSDSQVRIRKSPIVLSTYILKCVHVHMCIVHSQCLEYAHTF